MILKCFYKILLPHLTNCQVPPTLKGSPAQRTLRNILLSTLQDWDLFEKVNEIIIELLSLSYGLTRKEELF